MRTCQRCQLFCALNNEYRNAQSQDVIVRLIAEVLEKGFPVQHVRLIATHLFQSRLSCHQIFVDPVGPHEVYEAKLKALFPDRQFTVVPKADALFPVVSAASIVAKVTRDTFLEVWKYTLAEQGLKFDADFGSGYPSGEGKGKELIPT